MELSTANIVTSTSANTAAHKDAYPITPKVRIAILITKAPIMFYIRPAINRAKDKATPI